MQYEKFSEAPQKGDFVSASLKFNPSPEETLFSTDLQNKLLPDKPSHHTENHLPNKRERYRTRLMNQISGLSAPGKNHLERYILHKFRNNCKQNTIRNAHISIVKLLKFIQSHNRQEFETLKRSDIEAFVEYEQDRGQSPGTLSTRLVCLYAFIRFLVDDGVLDRELLKRKIHIKL